MLDPFRLYFYGAIILLAVGGYAYVTITSYNKGYEAGHTDAMAANRRETARLNEQIIDLNRYIRTERERIERERDALLQDALAADDGAPCLVSEAYRNRLNRLVMQ